MTPIELFTYTYPQLTLPIKKGMSQSEEYTNITRKCILPDSYIFPLDETGAEEVTDVMTPAGMARILYLPDRDIFEYFIRVLAYRCEPVEIPKTTGAMMISGVNNIRKYLEGNEDYKDCILIISKGFYSGITADEVGYGQEEWINISKVIRTYHELTHFITRRMFADHKDIVRDEVLADSIGIIAAINDFNPHLCKRLLGINYVNRILEIYDDARIKNYVNQSGIDEAVEYANNFIDRLNVFYRKYLEDIGETYESINPFDLLIAVEEAYIK